MIMKTIEEIDGKKVWAIDTKSGCTGCMFKNAMVMEFCAICDAIGENNDRNVIFQPYEDEQQEKTFTKEEVIDLCRSAHLHGVQGELGLHEQTFREWMEENL